MANWNQPALTDTYANFLAFLNAKLVDAAVGLDPAVTTVTNPPLNAIRYNSVANRWEKFNGTSYVVLSTGYAISITGNAATATTLATTRTINGVNFNGSANITVTASTTQAITFNSGGAGVASGTAFDGGTARIISYNTVGAPSVTGAGASGTWAIAISGNAATATTAATCSGNAASVTNGVYIVGDQAIGGAKSFSGLTTFTNGRAVVAATNFPMWELHIPGSQARGLFLDTDGVTRLSATNGGGVASTELLRITGAGSAVFAGDVTASSDERLKTNWRDLPESFVAELANVKMGVYDRIDNGITQVGVSAQSLQRVLPTAIGEGTDGMLSVAYGNAALASCVILAREVRALRAELNEMKGA